MDKKYFVGLTLCVLIFPQLLIAQAQEKSNSKKSFAVPYVINLNGIWDFTQTTNAFAPATFIQKIPVPGLVHLATPKIEEYDKFFKRPEKVNANTDHNVYDIDYTPRYSWYRKKISIPKELSGLEAVLTIRKSQYVTQVFVNGIDMGNFIECYTPIEVAISRALKFNAENEILIKVGDRYWLPSQSAGGTDKEKEHYLPGIWDNVSLAFTNKLKVDKTLLLPSFLNGKVTAKIQLWNLNHAQVIYGETMSDSVQLKIKITEARTKKYITSASIDTFVTRDRKNEIDIEIPFTYAHPWSPEDPFLYTAEISVYDKGVLSDITVKNFGMRDFERRGKFFYLNDKKYFLRGSNITLQRFFEDPDCGDLVWNKEWVKKMLIDIPKSLDWNAMRICVGIVPDFWYDLADEYGLVFQNEWFYWQNHGWDEQIKKEYTDWVWTDGSHPSIVIWDAINENRDNYIGNTLIPELKKLDPTRIWDAGYMTASAMNDDDMDEPHPYMGVDWDPGKPGELYPLGNLSYKPADIVNLEYSHSAQLVNEYGWVWLWRDGTPSKLTLSLYEKYLGKNSTVEQRRNFQAYWLECETEWLRSNSEVAGVLAFCYLTNNYGYTGDWFEGNVRDLKPATTLTWFKECFAPLNVFINLTDERYISSLPSHRTGEKLNFTLFGVNDLAHSVTGVVSVLLADSKGKIVYRKNVDVFLTAYERKQIPHSIVLPAVPGGYLLETVFKRTGSREGKKSRRFIRVGDALQFQYYESVK